MGYSSIVKKKCKCGCGKYPSMSCFGYAYSCLPPELKEKVGTKTKLAQKNRNKRSAITKKAHALQREVNPEAIELEKWFREKADVIASNPYCSNCGEWIAPEYYRHATAHIFSKKLFPSVATAKWNYLILGAGCGCHGQFDHSIERASKMPIWKKAVERYFTFADQITERHKYLTLFQEKVTEYLDTKRFFNNREQRQL